MILWAFLIGMSICGVTLALLRIDQRGDKFASAIASFATWCAFGMLLLAGTYGLGLVIPAITAALVLTFYKLDLERWLTPLASYKMPLGVGALICSVAAWIGVLNLMEEIPNV